MLSLIFMAVSEILLFVTVQMKMEIIILSEISWVQKSKYHMISLLCKIYQKKKGCYKI